MRGPASTIGMSQSGGTSLGGTQFAVAAAGEAKDLAVRPPDDKRSRLDVVKNHQPTLLGSLPQDRMRSV